MLLKIETLVPMEVTLVSRVNCWCADQEIYFFQGKYDVILVRGENTGAARN